MSGNPYQSSGDSGSGELGVNLDPHVTGNPIGVGVTGNVTVGHTLLIVIGALLLLWLFGGVFFKSIRM